MCENVGSGLDMDILLQCIEAATDGPFFPDWEFATLIGVERHELKLMKEQLYKSGRLDQNSISAVRNVLANLIGYPHGEMEQWDKYISVEPDRVRELLKNIAIHWRPI